MTYTMSPRVRKFALTTHITVSIGWLGAVTAYLALDIAVATSQNTQLVRAAWVGMGVIGWYVIVPLAVASLVTGLVMSLGTRWGLFRHYWVVISFLLTVIAILVLLTQVEHFSYAPTSAAGHHTTDVPDRRVLGGTLLHSGGGLLVLLVITVLNVYKPPGLTPYGWRKLREESTESDAQDH